MIEENQTITGASSCTGSGHRNHHRVRFAEENEIREFQRDEKEMEEVWWSSDHGSRNKEKCLLAGRKWSDKGYGVLLDDTFEKVDPSTQTKLDTFVMLESDKNCVPRGLEKYISFRHAEERRTIKIQNIERVVDLCTYMRRNNKSLKETEEELCDLSTQRSKCARKFARRMALADQRAVQEEHIAEFPEVTEAEEELNSVASSGTSSISSASSGPKKSLRGKARSAYSSGRKFTSFITGTKRAISLSTTGKHSF